jgi:hypothetical protein
MNRLSTLPSTREQARHALLLLGAPAPARLVVDVHRALFDGDLERSGLAALLRAERQAPAPLVCSGLTADLAAVHLALTEWPLERRIVTPATARADALTSLVRIAEFAGMRSGTSRAAERFLRSFGAELGLEAVDAREALADPALVAAIEAESVIREAAAGRAAGLNETQQLFGVHVLPHQRGGA